MTQRGRHSPLEPPAGFYPLACVSAAPKDLDGVSGAIKGLAILHYTSRRPLPLYPSPGNYPWARVPWVANEQGFIKPE